MITVTRITPYRVLQELTSICANLLAKYQHVGERDRILLADIADHMRQAAESANANKRIIQILHEPYPGPRQARPQPASQRRRKSADDTQDGQRQILAYLQANPGATTSQIASSVELPKATVYKHLERLCAHVQKERDGKHYRYTLTNQPSATTSQE